MENPNTTFIEYPNWPEKIKLLTALHLKFFIVKDPKAINGLSGVNIAVGLFLLAELFFLGDASTKMVYAFDFLLMFLGALNIVIGVFNLLYSKKVIAWIRDNSSWEERAKHKSSGKHKFQYLLIFIGIFAISYLIAYLLLLII